jgi:type IV pilus assembly protein PilY1
MESKNLVKVGRTLLIASLVAGGSSGSLNADDTEVYQASYSPGGAGGRPNVLIIFDDSGSMNTDVLEQPPAYDPSGAYPITDPLVSSMVYWSNDGAPPESDTSNYFPYDNNRCAESFGPMASVGLFTSKVLAWRQDGTVWESLADLGTNPQHVDCLVDLVNENPSNGDNQGNGYPTTPVGVYTADEEYSAATPEASDLDREWSLESKAYTFYSAHYMAYLDYIQTVSVTRTRLDIAQEAVKTIVASNPGIDFGLALFNSNTPDWFWNGSEWIGTDLQARSGGRVAKRILESDDASARAAHRASLATTIDGINSNGWTPLCESTYEVYRYLAGLDLVYGDLRDTSVVDGVVTDSPDRDPLAENPTGTYESPATDCSVTYIILMTDGLPTFDIDANARIKSLTGATSCGTYQDDYYETSENCLPELAAHMAATDIDNDASNGDQLSRLSTIGFTTDQTLLSDAATSGNGDYFVANDAAGLTAAFQGVIATALVTDVTFTSPAVAVDSFTRTQSRDDVFFSMFTPKRGIDWPGNIKKLKLDLDLTRDPPARLEDKDGNAAIDPDSGAIKPGISTYWSDGDGGDVEQGGVGALLAARVTARKILTNTINSEDSGLEDFNSTTLDAEGVGAVDDADLFDKFDVSDQTELDAVISWGQGYDAFDDDQDSNVTELRQWILADMLHSKPLVVNYGALGTDFDVDDPDLRIVVGTNAGFFHMFGNDDGEEDWAFFPKELAPVLKKRAENAISDEHVYGIDASPVLYTDDKDRDGIIEWNSDDALSEHAWVYFGLRRGGRRLYALDISEPDSPKFKWMLTGVPGEAVDPDMYLAELGQTWSDPVVTRIPGHVDDSGVPKPVLVFGAGYDPINDGPGIATATLDTMGRGLYIVDADEGTLLWSVTPASNSSTNLQELGLIHSVAGVVTPLDSNGDELTDRIYFGDTGGNIWRVDLPGSLLPEDASEEADTWRIVKLAAMNGGTAATDRRFFNAPDVVRTSYGDTVFDAVLIGSGDRTNPNATDVDNQFYMIRDKQVWPYFTARPTTSECTDTVDPIDDFRCDLPLVPADLYDATDNLIQAGDAGQRAAAALVLGNADGWRLDLLADGEKSLSSSITLQGTTYFGTFSPDTDLTDVCEPEKGKGYLYVVNLLNAAAAFDFDPNTSFERSWHIGTLIPDTPSVHVDEYGVIRLLLPPGSGGEGVVSNPFLTGASLPDPFGQYWYREEY